MTVQFYDLFISHIKVTYTILFRLDNHLAGLNIKCAFRRLILSSKYSSELYYHH